MITGQDIIITSLKSWDLEIGGNSKNVALEFARNNRVLFINSPVDRATLLRKGNDPHVKERMEILKGKSDDLIRISDNLGFCTPGQYWNRLAGYHGTGCLTWGTKLTILVWQDRYNQRLIAFSSTILFFSMTATCFVVFTSRN